MNKFLLSFSLFFVLNIANANVHAHSREQLSSENAPVAGPWDSEDGKLSFIQFGGDLAGGVPRESAGLMGTNFLHGMKYRMTTVF